MLIKNKIALLSLLFRLFYTGKALSNIALPLDTIEVRLQLIQQQTVNVSRSLSLGISIINHSDKDVFIPHFALFAGYSGIRLYRKEENHWTELDITTHSPKNPPKVGHREGNMFIDIDDPYIAPKNDLWKSLQPSANALHNEQTDLFRLLLPESSAQGINQALIKYPLFLKANSELINYSVFDLQWLNDLPGEYKITVSRAGIENQFDFSDTVALRNPLIVFPPYIGGYQRISPSHIASNDVYYRSVEGSQKK